MTNEPYLTDKANFVESDAQAIRQLAITQGLLIEFMEPIIESVTDDPEALQLWGIVKGLNKAVEVYSE